MAPLTEEWFVAPPTTIVRFIVRISDAMVDIVVDVVECVALMVDKVTGETINGMSGRLLMLLAAGAAEGSAPSGVAPPIAIELFAPPSVSF